MDINFVSCIFKAKDPKTESYSALETPELYVDDSEVPLFKITAVADD